MWCSVCMTVIGLQLNHIFIVFCMHFLTFVLFFVLPFFLANVIAIPTPNLFDCFSNLTSAWKFSTNSKCNETFLRLSCRYFGLLLFVLILLNRISFTFSKQPLFNCENTIRLRRRMHNWKPRWKIGFIQLRLLVWCLSVCDANTCVSYSYRPLRLYTMTGASLTLPSDGCMYLWLRRWRSCVLTIHTSNRSFYICGFSNYSRVSLEFALAIHI